MQTQSYLLLLSFSVHLLLIQCCYIYVYILYILYGTLRLFKMYYRNKLGLDTNFLNKLNILNSDTDKYQYISQIFKMTVGQNLDHELSKQWCNQQYHHINTRTPAIWSCCKCISDIQAMVVLWSSFLRCKGCQIMMTWYVAYYEVMLFLPTGGVYKLGMYYNLDDHS